MAVDEMGRNRVEYDGCKNGCINVRDEKQRQDGGGMAARAWAV